MNIRTLIPTEIEILQIVLLFTCEYYLEVHYTNVDLKACLKDTITVYLIYKTYSKFYENDDISPYRLLLMKYFIFLTSVTLEDYGQVFIQFFYHERYTTQSSNLTIINSILMVILSLKRLIDLADSPVDDRNGNYK